MHVALAASNEPGADAIRLLLYTGSRKSEVLGLKWSEVDLVAGVWTKPAARTKQRRTSRIPLSAPALDVLRRLGDAADAEDERREMSGLPPVLHVFPSSKAGQAQGSVRRLWAAVCRAAKISGVRLHDVRHSYASVLASAGLSLPIIGQLLGHSRASTTQRYAHLLDATLREATEKAGVIIGK